MFKYSWWIDERVNGLIKQLLPLIGLETSFELILYRLVQIVQLSLHDSLVAVGLFTLLLINLLIEWPMGLTIYNLKLCLCNNFLNDVPEKITNFISEWLFHSLKSRCKNSFRMNCLTSGSPRLHHDLSWSNGRPFIPFDAFSGVFYIFSFLFKHGAYASLSILNGSFIRRALY